MQGDERMEVRRRHIRHAERLALQIGELADAGPVARDERFGVVDVVENPEQRQNDTLRESRHDRAGARFAHLYGARRNCADDVRAAAELAIRDLVSGGLLDGAACLCAAPRYHHVLIADDHLARIGLCVNGRENSGEHEGSGAGDQRRRRIGGFMERTEWCGEAFDYRHFACRGYESIVRCK